MKKYILSVIIGCGLFAMATAQTNYVFQKTTETYQNLTNSISLNNGTQWDDPIYQFDLGFPFTLLDKTFNTLYVDMSGVDIANQNLDDESAYYSTVVLFSPLFIDLIDPCYEYEEEPGACSNISYKVEGEEGSRICKLEWNNASIYGFEPEVTLNIQVWFYEGSNILEFRFGDNTVTADVVEELQGDGFFSLIEAFNPMTESGRAIVVWGDPDNPTASMLDASDEDIDLESVYLNAMPTSGTVYRFIPEGVGIHNHDNLSITLSPNPVQNAMVLTGADGAQVQIYDILGNLLISENYNGPIDVEHLVAGTYIVKITTNNGSTIKKMIK